MAKKAKAPSKTAVEKLREFLDTTISAYPNPDRRSNEGRLLHEAWLWQEVKQYARDAEAAAWRALQAGDDRLVMSDDELRSHSAGEHIVLDSDTYSCLVSVEEPRRNFDRDTFVALISRKFNISAASLLKYVEMARKDSQPPLTKRIVCVEDK